MNAARPPFPRTRSAMVNQPVPADASPSLRSDLGDWTMVPMARVERMAANDAQVRREHQFATDGESRYNVPMLLCVAVVLLAACGVIAVAYKLLARPVASLFMQAISNPHAFGVGVGVVTVLVLGAVFGFRNRSVQA